MGFILSMVSPNWQILLSLKYEVWWHYLKGLFLSFQKIIKLLTLDPQNSSKATERVPKPLGGGGVVEHLSTAINLSIVHPMSNILWFSESLERYLSNDVFQFKISLEPKFDIFRPWTMGYNPWYRQIGKYFYLSNTKFDDTIWKVFF